MYFKAKLAFDKFPDHWHCQFTVSEGDNICKLASNQLKLNLCDVNVLYLCFDEQMTDMKMEIDYSLDRCLITHSFHKSLSKQMSKINGISGLASAITLMYTYACILKNAISY